MRMMRSGNSEATHISITLELELDQLTARIEEARKQRAPVGHGVSAEGIRHRNKYKSSIIEDHV